MREEKERAFDDYLAASARLGDREALGRLVQRRPPKLLGHAYRLTGETELAARTQAAGTSGGTDGKPGAITAQGCAKACLTESD